jgi:hypothetical protein
LLFCVVIAVFRSEATDAFQMGKVLATQGALGRSRGRSPLVKAPPSKTIFSDASAMQNFNPTRGKPADYLFPALSRGRE